MAAVFVSYRRSDSSAWARRLFDHLGMRFGRDLVFQDVETLGPGEIWMERIQEELSRCEVALVIIGPRWSSLVDEHGRRRLSDERDVLRREVAQALASPCTVVPVLVGGARMPGADELPGELRPLLERNASELHDSRWGDDVARLIEGLRELITPVRGAVTLHQVQTEAHERQEEYFERLERRDDAGALDSAQRLSRFLDRYMPLFPEDPYLKNCRGYSLKNEAMALRNLHRAFESDEALAGAERVFQTMRSENPHDADAWNGSGSVAMLRGQAARALELINRALEIDPSHEAALADRRTALEALRAERAP